MIITTIIYYYNFNNFSYLSQSSNLWIRYVKRTHSHSNQVDACYKYFLYEQEALWELGTSIRGIYCIFFSLSRKRKGEKWIYIKNQWLEVKIWGSPEQNRYHSSKRPGKGLDALNSQVVLCSCKVSHFEQGIVLNICKMILFSPWKLEWEDQQKPVSGYCIMFLKEKFWIPRR